MHGTVHATHATRDPVVIHHTTDTTYETRVPLYKMQHEAGIMFLTS